MELFNPRREDDNFQRYRPPYNSATSYDEPLSQTYPTRFRFWRRRSFDPNFQRSLELNNDYTQNRFGTKYKKPFRKNPIPSYGIILYTIIEGKIYFLISQRRDTIEYIEYLRGRYTPENLKLFLSLMTKEERDRLLSYSFDELWDDLWINKSHKLYTEEYERAKEKFNSLSAESELKGKSYLAELIDSTRCFLAEPPWGFPKGKKNGSESDLDCALREFEEETKMKIGEYTLVKDSTYNEIYIGSDKKTYSTHYFICEVKEKIPINKITGLPYIRTESVSEEISNLEWITIDEAKEKLNYKKSNLLLNVYRYICRKKRYEF